MKKNYKISKSELKKLYLDKKLSINQIAKKLNCSYWHIWEGMKYYGIKARSLSEANTLNNLKRKIIIPKKKLENLYLNKKLSILKIAKLYNCHHSVILRRLKEHNIKSRDSVEANTKYPKKDFDGSQADKAYLLGFTLGDLNVRKINERGRTLAIQCNSPIPQQINLVKNLFKNYGPVKIRDINSGFVKEKRVTIHLNESFEFLLYKKDKIPNWILSNKENFFAFLAGYTDAEGHIRTDIPTYLAIQSYDKTMLHQIYKNLMRFGLDCPKPRISKRKGYFSLKNPTPYKKDFWSIAVYSKKSLLNLFTKIKPYLKHGNKVNAMLKSIEQINYRNKEYGNQRM